MKDKQNNIFDDWINVHELDADAITEEVTCVNVDTRDFHLICDNTPVTKDYYGNHSGTSKQNFYAYGVISDKDCKDDFLIDRKDIIGWLQYLEGITKDGPNYDVDWRLFDFDIDYKQVNGWDFKYLRIFKHLHIPEKFVVCTDCLVAVHWKEMNEETVVRH